MSREGHQVVSALQQRREAFFKDQNMPGVTANDGNGKPTIGSKPTGLPLKSAPLANGESVHVPSSSSPPPDRRMPSSSTASASSASTASSPVISASSTPSPRLPLSNSSKHNANPAGVTTVTVNGIAGSLTYSGPPTSARHSALPPAVPPHHHHQQKETIIHGYVGFVNIPNQVYRKAIKKGFDFTLMVVGQSGLGKSTFINSLFLTDIKSNENSRHRFNSLIDSTIQVEESTVSLDEQGVNLNLTLVDTPGFGDAIDNSNCWEPVINYIDRKCCEYFAEETKINRSVNIPDKRVHTCLYFIAPSGHGLRALDIEFMKRIHDRVNIIPVIAKADTLTNEECLRFKKRIMSEIAQHRIKIYDFPDPDDEDGAKVQKPLKERVPFAVVGSNFVSDLGNGHHVRCRKYPWGVAEVENLEHNDFLALRNMLIRTHMIDLIDVTRSVHYENFRCRQLISVKEEKQSTGSGDRDPFTEMEEEMQQHSSKMRAMEQEMESVFQEKVKEKESTLREFEATLERQRVQSQEQIDRRRQEFAEKKKKYEFEKEAYKKENPAFVTYESHDSLPGALSPFRKSSHEHLSLSGKKPSSPGGKESGKRAWKSHTLGAVFRHKDRDRN